MRAPEATHPMRNTSWLAFLAMMAVASLAYPEYARAAAAPKAVAKCQAGLAKAGAKFVGKKLGLLAKCTNGVVKCIETIDDTSTEGAAKRTDCITKARAKCAAAIGGIGAARTAFGTGATKACASLDSAQITAGDGLGFAATCTGFGGAPVTDLASMSTCLAKSHDCLAGEIFQFQVPRVQELLQFTPPDAVTVTDPEALACLDDVGGVGADVNDPSLGKSVAKCQASVAKIGAKLTSQRLGALGKCVGAAFVCAATKTGDDLTACNAKANAGCTKAFAKNDDQDDAAAAATGKACGDATVFPAFLSPEGGNLEALRPSMITTPPQTERGDATRAISAFCTPLVTVADYQRCLIAHIFGLVEELFTAEAPRTKSLLTAIGCSIGACTPTGPGPGDPVGISRILDATGDSVHAFANAFHMTTDAQDNVYVVGSGSDNVFRITPAGTVTQIIGPDGDGMGHPLDFPVGVAVDANRNVYVLASSVIFKIDSGGAISRFVFGQFNGGQSIVVTPDGTTVYVASSNTTVKFASNGTKTLLMDASGDGQGHPCALALHISVDAGGNAFVSCQLSDTVFKIASNGALTRAVTATGDGTNPLSSPQKNAARGTTAYVNSVGNDSVFKIIGNGTVSRILSASGDDAGHTLDGPSAVAVDPSDNVYVTGIFSNNAFRVTPGGTVTPIIDATGDGKGNTLAGPTSLATDTKGRIYVGGGGNVFKIVLP